LNESLSIFGSNYIGISTLKNTLSRNFLINALQKQSKPSTTIQYIDNVDKNKCHKS